MRVHRLGIGIVDVGFENAGIRTWGVEVKV